MIKVAVVVSHPIQHFCPMYESWAALSEVDLTVFFASTAGKVPYKDKKFGREVQWEELTLNFGHKFLNDGRLVDVSVNLDAEALDVELDQLMPDVLVVYGYAQKLQRRAARWGYRKKVHVLMISDSELRQHRRLLVRVAKRLALRRVYSKITMFLTVGDANEEYYRHYGVRSSQLIRSPFPIDKNKVEMVLSNKNNIRKIIREQLRISENSIVITVVGKLVPWKCQKDLISVLNYISRDELDLTLLIVGTGPDEKDLKRLSKNVLSQQVIFTGFVQPKKLLEYYISTNIYIHPSEKEPHSLAISEAIYCGCPIILNDRCGSFGPTDDVRIGYNGFVYECGNVQQLAHYIKTLAQSEELMLRFSRNSRIIGVQNQVLAHGEGLRSALVALGFSVC